MEEEPGTPAPEQPQQDVDRDRVQSLLNLSTLAQSCEISVYEASTMTGDGDGGSTIAAGSAFGSLLGHDDPTALASNRHASLNLDEPSFSATDTQFIDELSAIGRIDEDDDDDVDNNAIPNPDKKLAAVGVKGAGKYGVKNKTASIAKENEPPGRKIHKLQRQLKELDKAQEEWKTRMQSHPIPGQPSRESNNSGRAESGMAESEAPPSKNRQRGLNTQPSVGLVRDMDSIVKYARLTDENDTDDEDRSITSEVVLASELLGKVSMEEEDYSTEPSLSGSTSGGDEASDQDSFDEYFYRKPVTESDDVVREIHKRLTGMTPVEDNSDAEGAVPVIRPLNRERNSAELEDDPAIFDNIEKGSLRIIRQCPTEEEKQEKRGRWMKCLFIFAVLLLLLGVAIAVGSHIWSNKNDNRSASAASGISRSPPLVEATPQPSASIQQTLLPSSSPPTWAPTPNLRGDATSNTPSPAPTSERQQPEATLTPTLFPTMTQTEPEITVSPTSATSAEPTSSDKDGDETSTPISIEVTPLPTERPSAYPTLSPTKTDSSSPTPAPTSSPTKTANLREILFGISGASIDDPTTPQFKAAQWMEGEFASKSTSDLSSKEIIDRYTSALLYHSLDGEKWIQQYGFLGGNSVCEWNGNDGMGVRCDKDGMIREIAMNNNSLEGMLPSELGVLGLKEIDMRNNRISGSIPSQFDQLSDLESLDLGYNDLTGEIPPAIFDSTSLRSFVLLSNERLEGNLPSTIGLATNLDVLSLRDCNLGGRLPTEMGLLSRLSFLNLQNNDFTGALPDDLLKLANLELLVLTGNSFTGTIPEFGTQTWFYMLSLDGNRFSGPIPDSLGNIESMMWFDVSDNNLSGTIPSVMNSLPYLSNVFLSKNGLHGSIPSFSNSVNLQSLQLSRNELSGNIDTFLVAGPSKLESIDFSANGFRGTIPPEIARYQSLSSLNLAHNAMVNAIPSEIGQLGELRSLQLDANMLSKGLPSELGQCTKLTRLEVQNNFGISGTVPAELTRLTALDFLFLDHTGLTGDVDPIFCPNGDATNPIWRFATDCADQPDPRVTCSCCTSCCSIETGRCAEVDY